jgi:peptide/nickel transport system substrate-binding protein
MSNSMNSLVVTLQPDKGLGPTNRGRYSNKQVDDLVVKAMATVDDTAREKLLQEASKLAMSDYGIIPLHFEVTPWAFKKGLSYQPRVDQYTLATEVTQVGS